MVQGGNPEMRPDQELRAQSRAGSGPAPQNIVVVARQVIVFGPGGGLFVYNATRTVLEESIAGAATTDPVLHVAVPAGTATYNSSGKVISLLSVTNKAFFQYADAGATQGQLIASLSSSAGTDPVAGFAYNAGLYGLDPVGGNITTAGPVISFGEIPYTRSGQIKPVIGSGAVRPYLQLDAPEQTTASHLQMVMAGASPDGTKTAQLLIGAVTGSATLTSAGVQDVVEIQGSVGLTNTTAPGNLPGVSQIYSNSSGTLAQVDAAGLFTNVSGGQLADLTTYTVTAITATTCTKIWTIPTPDAAIGGTYKLTAIIAGTQGSTAQALTFNANVAGDTAPALTLPSTFTVAGAGFAIKVEMTLTIVTTGAGGTVHNFAVAVTGQAGTTPGVVQEWIFLSRPFNTTAAQSVSLQAKWGSTTGAPTMTTEVNYFQKVA